MPIGDKYFYATHGSFGRQNPEVIKWNEDITLAVEENVDWRQWIELSILKNGEKDTQKPKSDKYHKYKPIIEEIFLQHYKLALKYIHETTIDEGEFYLYTHSSHWWQVYYFSKDEKRKWSIEIDFRDFINNLWLMFRCGPGHKDRPQARKNGVAITDVQFKQFLNLTVQYFYDPDSLPIYRDDYIKNFRKLCGGDTKIDGFIISAEKTLNAIMNQLEARKEHLEKRLIENDNDSINDRLKLRGELEGIEYAMKVIKTTIN